MLEIQEKENVTIVRARQMLDYNNYILTGHRRLMHFILTAP